MEHDDRVVEARMRVRHPASLASRLPPGAMAVQIGTDGEDGVYVVTTETGEGFAAFLQALGPAVERRGEREALVRLPDWESPAIAAVREHGGVLLPPSTYAHREENHRVLAPSRRALAGLLETLGAVTDVEILSIVDSPLRSLGTHVPVAGLVAGLTARQLALLRGAVEAGYYEMPRRVPAQALATAEGISASTYQEHLRKAEREILRAFARLFLHHPQLAHGAMKSPGRPRREITAPTKARG